MLASHENGFEIAVIGLSCRFPGADNDREFWENLRDGVDSITDFSEEQALLSGCSVEEVLDENFIKSRGVLKHPFDFDEGFFAMTPREAAITDPQQRMFLQCAWEAFEDAGHIPGENRNVGVFVGSSGNSYQNVHVAPNKEEVGALGHLYKWFVSGDNFLPCRVSYKFDLCGPSIYLNATCATSLVAIDMARKALLAGDCDMALAGAVSISFPLFRGFSVEESGGAVSTTGRCRSFDKSAHGTVLSHGVAALLLKRLSDAREDGDNIRAVIKGSAVTNDGRQKIGFTAPTVQGQLEAARQAFAAAELDPSDIAFVEAHGSATQLGDPIEVAALAAAFGAVPLGHQTPLGSVKSNIGHTAEAAGAAGVIKSILALENGKLPASIHFEEANPQLNIEKTPFFIPRDALSLSKGNRVLRASVNSVGLGGTNAHLILEEAPPIRRETRKGGYHLLTLSARTPCQLNALINKMIACLEQADPVAFPDIAYTSRIGRKPFSCRLAVVANSCSQAIDMLRREGALTTGELVAAAKTSPVPTIMVTGLFDNTNALPELVNEFEELRVVLDRYLNELNANEMAGVSTVLGLANNPDAVSDRSILLAQFVLKLALSQLWLAWLDGSTPVTGFGIGKLVADVASGEKTVQQALAFLRAARFDPDLAHLLIMRPSAGVRALLEAGGIKVVERQRDDWILVEGRISAVNELASRCEKMGAAVGQVIGSPSIDSGIWNAHASDMKPADRAAITLIASLDDPFTRSARIWSPPDYYIPTPYPTEKNRPEFHVLRSVAELWRCGCGINWKAFPSATPRQRVRLPTYPFATTTFRLEPICDNPYLSHAGQAKSSRSRDAGAELPAFSASAGTSLEEEISKRIVSLWQGLLGVESVKVSDSFIELGGDSLLGARLAMLLRDTFDIDIPLGRLFVSPVLSDQVALITDILVSAVALETKDNGINLTKQDSTYELS